LNLKTNLPQNLKSDTLDICYVSAIPKAGSEVVISFLNRANHFSRICLFCNFVTNTIYVLEVEMLEPVFMARKHKFGKASNLILDHMISQVFPEVG
jgi:hypothetical protein